MIPISDDKPAARFPIIVICIVLANCYVFFQEFMMSPSHLELFIEHYGMIPVRDYTASLQLGPFFTSMFLHGSLPHLLLNLWSFWIFGDNIEGVMGPLRFLVFYILCGLAAAFAHASFHPFSEVPVVGASGAIAGVMGAYLVLFPAARIRMFTLLVFYPITFEIPAFVFLILWLIGQIMSGAAAYDLAQSGVDSAGGIAFIAHAGGFLAGIALLPLFRRRSSKTSLRSRPLPS